jgi:transcriptional regulator with XRE-family HTH domain
MKQRVQSTGYGKEDAPTKPVALHVRRRRQWYGAKPLSQTELASLSGVSERHIRRLEDATRLPRPVEILLRLAIALDVSLEALIDPRHVNPLTREIELRRAERRRSAHRA